jgi:hypothetical protein
MNQEFTLDIYIQKKNDNPCLIKVSSWSLKTSSLFIFYFVIKIDYSYMHIINYAR